MKPYKVMQQGTALNCVLINTQESIVPILSPLFHATNNLKYYLVDWARTQTLVMKKPGKPNYTSPGAWRPIVLSNSFARLMNRCQTDDIGVMCEQLNILPSNNTFHSPTDSCRNPRNSQNSGWNLRNPQE
jgi:hypothetical protein